MWLCRNVKHCCIKTNHGSAFGSQQIQTHHRSLWRGDTKTLRQDTSVVGGTRTVPEQLTIVQLLEGTVTLMLPLSNNLEDL